MSHKDMKVTGLVIHNSDKFELRGSGLGSSLQSITVNKDLNGPPPSAGTASGTVGNNSANISAASVEVWDDMNAKLVSFPFKATVTYTGSTTVTDLSFGNVSSAALARQTLAADVHALRSIAMQLATKLLPEGHWEPSTYEREKPVAERANGG